MNKPLVIGLALIVCGGVTAGILLRPQQPSAVATLPPPHDQQAAVLQHVDKPILAAAPLQDWQRLPQMSSDEQERYATRVMTQSGWSPEMRAGLLGQLANRSLAPVTRNNLAIGVLRNNLDTGDLERALWAAYDDDTEDPIWREYALQFMAVCLEEGSTNAGSRTRLVDAFHGSGSRSATAAIQLHRLADKNVMPLPADFSAIVVARAGDPAMDAAQRGTLLGIIGMRRLPDGRAVARAYLGEADLTLRRTAFACLGDIGTAEDLPAIEAGLLDPQPLVQKAAAAAKAKIASRSMNR